MIQYLLRRGYTKTARHLVQENPQGVAIGSVDNRGINAPNSFLFEWWSVIYPLLSSATCSGKPDPSLLSDLASAVSEHSRPQAGASAEKSSANEDGSLFVSPELLELDKLGNDKLQSIGPLPQHLQSPPVWNWPTASEQGTVKWPEFLSPFQSPTTSSSSQPAIVAPMATPAARKRPRSRKTPDEAAVGLMVGGAIGEEQPQDSSVDTPAPKKGRGGKTKSPAARKSKAAAVAQSADEGDDSALDPVRPLPTPKRKPAVRRKTKTISQDAGNDSRAQAIAAAMASSPNQLFSPSDGPRPTALSVPSQGVPLHSAQALFTSANSSDGVFNQHIWSSGHGATSSGASLPNLPSSFWKSVPQQRGGQYPGGVPYQSSMPSAFVIPAAQQRPPSSAFTFPHQRGTGGASCLPSTLNTQEWKDCPLTMPSTAIARATAHSSAPTAAKPQDGGEVDERASGAFASSMFDPHHPSLAAGSSSAQWPSRPSQQPLTHITQDVDVSNVLSRIKPEILSRMAAAAAQAAETSMSGHEVRGERMSSEDGAGGHGHAQSDGARHDEDKEPMKSDGTRLQQHQQQQQDDQSRLVPSALLQQLIHASSREAASHSSLTHHHAHSGSHHHLFAPSYAAGTQNEGERAHMETISHLSALNDSSQDVGLDEETERLLDACVAEYCAERDAAGERNADGANERMKSEQLDQDKNGGESASDAAHDETKDCKRLYGQGDGSGSNEAAWPAHPDLKISQATSASPLRHVSNVAASSGLTNPTLCSQIPIMTLSRVPSISGSVGRAEPTSEASSICSASATTQALRDKVQRSMTAQYEAMELFTELYAPQKEGEEEDGAAEGRDGEGVGEQQASGVAGCAQPDIVTKHMKPAERGGEGVAMDSQAGQEASISLAVAADGQQASSPHNHGDMSMQDALGSQLADETMQPSSPNAHPLETLSSSA